MQTVFRTEMLGINAVDASAQAKYTSNRTDGTLGLAPYGPDRHISFLYQLFRDGYIDQMIFSVYMKMSNRRDSHIKFGGFDEDGALGGVS